MYRCFNSSLKREVINIFPGEIYVTSGDEIITTVLGSCISACVYDTKNRLGGMNHFMLPVSGNRRSSAKETSPEKDIKNFYSEELRYGTIAMECLVGEIQKKGGERRYLRAKYFGGGKVLRTNDSLLEIGLKNINFAEAYFSEEKIPVDGKDVGGIVGRKIFFIIRENKVLCKELEISDSANVLYSETQYREKLIHQDTSGSVELF